MAGIKWKDARWEGALDSRSIPELLTILKGYGQTEIVRFEKSGCSRGELSLCLTESGAKEVTLYCLEVAGKKRQGKGRATLKWLRSIFKGPIYLEFPDLPAPEPACRPSLPFWLQMYREGLIDVLDCEIFYLGSDATQDEIQAAEEVMWEAMKAEATSKTA